MKKLLFLLLLCIPIKYINAKCLYSDLAELKKQLQMLMKVMNIK